MLRDIGTSLIGEGETTGWVVKARIIPVSRPSALYVPAGPPVFV